MNNSNRINISMTLMCAQVNIKHLPAKGALVKDNMLYILFAPSYKISILPHPFPVCMCLYKVFIKSNILLAQPL